MFFLIPGGPPHSRLQLCEPSWLDDGLRLRIAAATGWGASWWVAVIDGRVAEVFRLDETAVPRTFVWPVDCAVAVHAFAVMPIGPWSYLPPNFDPTFAQEYWVLSRGGGVSVEWDAVVEALEAYGDSQQLSNLSLSGLRRWENCAPTNELTRGRLNLVLATAGGVHTLTVYNGTESVASGSRTGDGTITLAATNSSGVTGSVDLTYTGDLAFGTAWLEARWAKQYNVYVDAVLATAVRDKGYTNRLAVRLASVAAGTHSVTVKGVNDNAVEGSASTPVSITVATRPDAPGTWAYASGNAAACVISGRGSTTAGATLRAYLQQPGGVPMDMETPAATAALASAWQASTGYTLGQYVAPVTANGYRYECTRAGTSGTSQPTWPTTVGGTVVEGNPVTGLQWTCAGYVMTLPAITGYAGTARVLVRAVLAGVESGNGDTLALEFDAGGSIVLPRPNVPGAVLVSVSGRTLTVDVEHAAEEALGTATVAQLFLAPEAGDWDWETPAGTAVLPAAATGDVQRARVTATAVADGWYRWAVRVATAGGVQSNNTTLFGPVWLSTAAPAAPGNPAAYIEA